MNNKEVAHLWANQARESAKRGAAKSVGLCAKCYVKTAGDGSWAEIVTCAVHKRAPWPGTAKRHFRVSWTEQYEKVFEAESEEAAIENRDDKNAFLECSEVTAQEVVECRPVGHGLVACHGCDHCESGWRPVNGA